MTDPKTVLDAGALDARIRELEVKVQRMPLAADVLRGDNTHCGSGGCTNCRGDGLVNVLLPGEETPLSGADLVMRLRATRPGATN